MNNESLAILDNIINESTLSLFAVSGMQLVPVTDLPEEHDHTFAATIGFTNPRLRGMLVLTTDRNMVSRSRPAELRSSTPSEQDLNDWAGELVNQLIGRIKNQLLRHQIDLQLSIPSVVRGKLLRRALPDALISHQANFTHAAGSIYICFDAVAVEGLEFKAVTEEPEGISEGELTLF